ncbi:MAG: hypothetical protein GY795_12320 [Desulfobacterales bacterium]|nr:hypothetical protein [Desulfobacterales bacterium]
MLSKITNRIFCKKKKKKTYSGKSDLFPEKHLMKHIYLPFPNTSEALHLKDSVFYIFDRDLKYPDGSVSPISLKSCGVGEIQIHNDFFTNAYPLNIIADDTNLFTSGKPDFFSAAAVSGNDLIIHTEWNSLGESPAPHYLFCSDPDKKDRSRIVSIDGNGIYHKQQIRYRETDRYFLKKEDACLYSDGTVTVRSTEPGKLRILRDERPCDEYGTASDEDEDSINFYKTLCAESDRSTRHISDKNFLDASDSLTPLRLNRIVISEDTFEIVTIYRIHNLTQYLIQHDELLNRKNEAPYISNSGSVLFDMNSEENMIGVFLDYIFPLKQDYGVFLVFKPE